MSLFHTNFTRNHRLRHTALCGLLWALLTVTMRAGARIEPPSDPAATPATKIQAGCSLSITVTDEPQLSGVFVVAPAGTVHFQMTDEDGDNKEEWDVSVKDKTADEATNIITENLKKYLQTPEVRVVIARLPRIPVEISGAARITGKIELAPNARVSDAMAACVYKPNADLENVRILRQAKSEDGKPGKPRAFTVDFAAYLQGTGASDPLLEPGDKIIIEAHPTPPPGQELKIVRIVGEVNREASLPLSPGMTIHDAFDRAGGLKETADRDKIRLVRGSDGRMFEVEANRVESNDPVHNLPLGAGDLIIVGMRDRSLRFAVLGEVSDQRTFEWDPKDKMTVLKALEMAGGLTKKGDKHKGILKRNYLLNPAQSQELAFDLDLIAKGKQADYELEPGDAIFIPTQVRKPSVWQQLLPLALHFLPLGI